MHAYVIERATAQVKSRMIELVHQMNDEEPIRVSVGEYSRFELQGLGAVETFSDFTGCESKIEWHFVRCACGHIDIRHGEEDDPCCPECGQVQSVHSRAAQRVMGVKWV